jgi:surface antigen
MFRLIVPALLSLLLAACGSSRGPADAGNYVGGAVALECAPFARALTGVALRGDAADWWDGAQGRYARGNTPVVGGVLVFTRSARLPYGHVAVVSHLLERRKILVTQANWVHHRVTQDQAIIDVSPGNDWTELRVFWPPSGQMGTGVYTAYGFVSPGRRTTHEEIAQATPKAIRLASSGY